MLLAHLALLALLEGLLAGAIPPVSPQNPISVQMISPAPPPPVAALKKKLSPQAKPAEQPKIITVEPSPPPQTAQASEPAISTPEVSPVAADLALPLEESFDSSLDPRGAGSDLAQVVGAGSVAMTAYWGDFSSGSPIGHSKIELSFPEPDRYAIKMVTEAAGWARLFASAPMLAEAHGRLGPEGFVPERYAHKGPRRSELTVFDYEKREVRYESIKDPLPLLKGVQDRLTFMIQLAWMLQQDPDRFSLGQIVTLPIAGRNKLEEVEFVVLSDADLALPGGLVVPALHLSSNRQTNRYSVQIDVWMDRTDRLLPVRIRFEEARGTVLDLLTARN